MNRRQRFGGWIAGVGSSSGTRVVLGLWQRSPLGSFADVMVQRADGHRVLLAPDAGVEELVAGTYRFDETRVGPVEVRTGARTLGVRAPGLALDLVIGGRTALGLLLHALPSGMAASPTWLRAIHPLAVRLQPGTGTAGSAGGGRREFYGVSDLHRVLALRGHFDGRPLGVLAPVAPPVAFGFASPPRRPSLATVTTTIIQPPGTIVEAPGTTKRSGPRG